MPWSESTGMSESEYNKMMPPALFETLVLILGLIWLWVLILGADDDDGSGYGY